MNLIRFAIERPIAVIAAVLMVVMFGMVALQTIPIQLSPDVNRPVITVTTSWPGAAPAEVEREILNRQGKDIVFVAKGDEVEARPVRLGTAVGSRMEVLDGLGEGEQVVVRGNERLRPGAKIQVVGES